MRAVRGLAMAAAVVAALIPATSAGADGGAYVDLQRTHYLPGQTAVGETYISVPRNEQDRLDRGPFYAYVVPKGSSVIEGKPIPGSVIRVGTFSIERYRATSFELHVSFTVPDVPGDEYSIALCNDPCTISGFKEPISGFLSVVHTAREGALLTEQSRLEGQIYGLRRDLRKAEREEADVQTSLDAAEAARSQLTGDIVELRSALAASTRPTRPGSRPFIETWAAVVLGIALLMLAAAIVIRRRKVAPIVVPDTIEELVPETDVLER